MRNLYLLFLLFLASCHTGKPRQFAPGIVAINVPDVIDNKPLTDFTQFVDSSWFVSLSLTGNNDQGYITKAVAHQGKIYTLDELQSRTLNVYDSIGSFLYDLAPRGKGPLEALNITDFSVCGNEVFVTDILQKRIQVFSTNDGSHIRTITPPFSPHDFTKLGDNRYLFVLSPYNEDMGDDYQKHSILLTDSTLTPIKLQIPRPVADLGNGTRSVWNTMVGGNSAFSMFHEIIYQYNPISDSMEGRFGFDYVQYNAPDDARNDYRAYMKFYNDDGMSLSTNSPLVVGEYIIGTVNYDSRFAKYMLVYDGKQAYAKKLQQETYDVTEPMDLLGTSGDNTLISLVEPTIGLPQLISRKLPIAGGKTITEESSMNVLLFTRLK